MYAVFINKFDDTILESTKELFFGNSFCSKFVKDTWNISWIWISKPEWNKTFDILVNDCITWSIKKISIQGLFYEHIEPRNVYLVFYFVICSNPGRKHNVWNIAFIDDIFTICLNETFKIKTKCKSGTVLIVDFMLFIMVWCRSNCSYCNSILIQSDIESPRFRYFYKVELRYI